MNTQKKIIDTTWDDEIIENIQNMYRSYSCRGAESIIFPLDFVPRLKPKLHGTLPSPMNLGIKCNKLHIKLEEIKIDGALE
jgi:hypothetical protein